MTNLNNNMIKYIIKNGGATLTSRLTHANLKAGYMVSLPDHEQVVSLEDATTINLNKFIDIAKSINGYVGIWLNNDKVYFDISVNILDLAEALRLAKAWKQLAIYDIVNDTTINLK